MQCAATTEHVARRLHTHVCCKERKQLMPAFNNACQADLSPCDHDWPHFRPCRARMHRHVCVCSSLPAVTCCMRCVFLCLCRCIGKGAVPRATRLIADVHAVISAASWQQQAAVVRTGSDVLQEYPVACVMQASVVVRPCLWQETQQ